MLPRPDPPRRSRCRASGIACTALILQVACAPADPPPVSAGGTTPSGIAWTARGDGPAVLLIHGTNLDRRVWDPVADDLAADHTVIRYDLRNHGGSVDATGPWSDLDDLAAVLEAAEREGATLVGLSSGAGIALEFALARPASVRGLVLVSPSVRGFVPAPGEVPDVFGPLGSALGGGDTTAIAGALLALPTFDAPPGRRPMVEAMVRSNLRLFGVDPAWAEPYDDAPLTLLGELDVPTAVLVGTGDFAAVTRLATELAEGISGAGLTTVEGGPHLLPLSHPDRVARAVRAVAPP